MNNSLFAIRSFNSALNRVRSFASAQQPNRMTMASAGINAQGVRKMQFGTVDSEEARIMNCQKDLFTTGYYEQMIKKSGLGDLVTVEKTANDLPVLSIKLNAGGEPVFRMLPTEGVPTYFTTAGGSNVFFSNGEKVYHDRKELDVRAFDRMGGSQGTRGHTFAVVVPGATELFPSVSMTGGKTEQIKHGPWIYMPHEVIKIRRSSDIEGSILDPIEISTDVFNGGANRLRVEAYNIAAKQQGKASFSPLTMTYLIGKNPKDGSPVLQMKGYANGDHVVSFHPYFADVAQVKGLENYNVTTNKIPNAPEPAIANGTYMPQPSQEKVDFLVSRPETYEWTDGSLDSSLTLVHTDGRRIELVHTLPSVGIFRYGNEHLAVEPQVAFSDMGSHNQKVKRVPWHQGMGYIGSLTIQSGVK